MTWCEGRTEVQGTKYTVLGSRRLYVVAAGY